MTDEICEATGELVASGLYQFYKSIVQFWMRYAFREESGEEEDDPFEAITLHEFMGPFTMLSYYILFAVAVFLAELIWFRIRVKCHQFAMQERSIERLG